MKVLLTRRSEDNARMVPVFARHGLETVSLPLVELEDSGCRLPEGEADFTIFTSAAAVAILARRGVAPLAGKPAYAVGERTSDALAMLAYKDIRIGDGSAADLAARIIAEQSAAMAGAPSPTGLYLCGETRRAELEQRLEAAGIALVIAELYRLRPLDMRRQALETALAAVRGGAIAVFSAESGLRLMAQVRRHGMETHLSTLLLAGISEPAIRPLPANLFRKVIHADGPDAGVLAQAIQRNSR
ncbi:MAG: uroporphyrinogen-III synthase [Nitratireductor sp.]|nr:uroporphyrinogen-III synthase [Nitratireductor sp.]